MSRRLPIRTVLDRLPMRGATLTVGLIVSLTAALGARAQMQSPAPIERRAPARAAAPPGTAGYPYVGSQPASPLAQIQRHQNLNSPIRGEHLAEWMTQHSNLSPQQQQQALEHEPGFQELPQPTQQRMLNRLQQLDTMNPNQRQQLLEHNEALERLDPAQRQQLTGALQQLGSLPMEQRMQVSRTFRLLRDVPPPQRMDALNSGRFGPPLNGYQRDTLIRLLQVEPFMAPPANRMRLAPR